MEGICDIFNQTQSSLFFRGKEIGERIEVYRNLCGKNLCNQDGDIFPGVGM